MLTFAEPDRVEESMASWLVIEGGGSRTWAALSGAEPHAVSSLSTNPHSCGRATAEERLRSLVRELLEQAGTVGAMVAGVVAGHGAVSDQASARRFHGLVRQVADSVAVAGPVIVTNDLVPVLHAVSDDVAVAVVAGTGTGFGSRRGSSRYARVGGREYLISDEGGGFDLGRQGLRAVLRSLDGRGARTELVDRARAWCGGAGDEDLADRIVARAYGHDHKPVIASFAEEVIAGAAAADAVAASIVGASAEEIVLAAEAVARRVAPPDRPAHFIFSGSMLMTSNPLSDAVTAGIRARVAVSTITIHEQAGDVAALMEVAQRARESEIWLAAVKEAFPVVVG